MSKPASNIEKAYGLLWRDMSGNQDAHEARKILLSTIGKDGQQRGIAWAAEHCGEVTMREIMDNLDNMP